MTDPKKHRICTVANYEYAIYYNFYQDGNMDCSIKLTGILNLYTMAEGEDAGKYGTEVAPRVMAHHHQVHLPLRNPETNEF